MVCICLTSPAFVTAAEAHPFTTGLSVHSNDLTIVRIDSSATYEYSHEKTKNLDFLPCRTQTGLYNC